MRNKPKEPPKKPKSAPFFLPTVAGLETKFDFSKENQDSTVSRTFVFTNVYFVKTLYLMN